MSYNSLLADFQTILNRDDCTTAQAEVFITQGVQRIQRTCRLPSMERQEIVTIGDAGANFVLVPQDMIQPIDLVWTSTTRDFEPRALKKLPYRDIIRKNGLDLPRWYARMQGQYWVAGAMIPGEVIQIFYYGNFSNWANGNADNELSASTPDLAVYAALGFAGDYFEAPLAAQWEQRFQTIKAEVEQMGIDLDAEGGEQVMAPVYHWD